VRAQAAPKPSEILWDNLRPSPLVNACLSALAWAGVAAAYGATIIVAFVSLRAAACLRRGGSAYAATAVVPAARDLPMLIADAHDADALAPEEPAMPVQAGASLVEALPQAHFAALSKLLSEATDWLVLLQVRAAPPRRAAPTPRDAHLPPLRKPPFLSPRQYHAASPRVRAEHAHLIAHRAHVGHDEQISEAGAV
jgi:hypothetical protein